MTEKLRDVLQEEAGAAQVPPTDLGPLLRAGARAVRRRRVVGSGVVAAVAALAVAIAPSVVDLVRGGQQPASADNVLTAPYVDRDTLHFGDVEVARPDRMDELVYASDAGYAAYTVYGPVYGSARDAGVFVVTPDGEVTRVDGGPIRSGRHLVSDGENEVAWLEASGGGAPVVAVRHASGDISRIELGPDFRNAWLAGVDDGVVYFNAKGKVWAVSDGAEPEPTGWTSYSLIDHSGGIAAVATDRLAQQGCCGTIYIRNENGQVIGRVGPDVFADTGDLEVGGGPHDVVFLAERERRGPVLVDVRTGEATPFVRVDGFEIDQATLVDGRVLATAYRKVDGAWTTRVLSCSLSGDDCQVVDEQTVTSEHYLVPDSAMLTMQLEFPPA